jgi:hypothetical protein
MQDIIDLIDQTIDEEIERMWEEMEPPPGLINTETGESPTTNEWEAIKRRAYEILSNPYAAPELIDWAAPICPDGLMIPYRSGFESVNKNQIRVRQ